MCFRQSHLLQADAVDGVHEHLGRHHKLTLRLQRCDELAAVHVLRKHLLQCKTDSTRYIPYQRPDNVRLLCKTWAFCLQECSPAMQY